mmetsp:Transcript_28319/g.82023  ORF Transcript_28319/g.82023 Transcript_28319/m.82023 type:complete len:360 (+) Transcript_28319:1540-2619(+)
MQALGLRECSNRAPCGLLMGVPRLLRQTPSIFGGAGCCGLCPPPQHVRLDAQTVRFAHVCLGAVPSLLVCGGSRCHSNLPAVPSPLSVVEESFESALKSQLFGRPQPCSLFNGLQARPLRIQSRKRRVQVALRGLLQVCDGSGALSLGIGLNPSPCNLGLGLGVGNAYTGTIGCLFSMFDALFKVLAIGHETHGLIMHEYGCSPGHTMPFILRLGVMQRCVPRAAVEGCGLQARRGGENGMTLGISLHVVGLVLRDLSIELLLVKGGLFLLQPAVCFDRFRICPLDGLFLLQHAKDSRMVDVAATRGRHTAVGLMRDGFESVEAGTAPCSDGRSSIPSGLLGSRPCVDNLGFRALRLSL